MRLYNETRRRGGVSSQGEPKPILTTRRETVSLGMRFKEHVFGYCRSEIPDALFWYVVD
jgi:hypothetical protein